MDTLHPDILRLFEELNQQGVKYMVVGMSSAIMQGVPANTQDIDIWFEHYSDPKVLKAVNNAGEEVVEPGVPGKPCSEVARS